MLGTSILLTSSIFCVIPARAELISLAVCIVLGNFMDFWPGRYFLHNNSSNSIVLLTDRIWP